MPISNRQGDYLGQLNGKPAALVVRLSGQSCDRPTAALCERVGTMLGKMHRAAQSYSGHASNRRGVAWRRYAAAAVRPFLSADSRTLIEREVELQARYNPIDLPCGAIHGDLFTDNVLCTENEISGVIDFYFACTDLLLYDLAIAACDWCIGPDCRLDRPRLHALVESYLQARPRSAAGATVEAQAWPLLLRRAALRFWLSRLYDQMLPRLSQLNQPKDPHRFQKILTHLISEQPPSLFQ